MYLLPDTAGQQACITTTFLPSAQRWFLPSYDAESSTGMRSNVKRQSFGQTLVIVVKCDLEGIVDVTSVLNSSISDGRHPVQGIELPEALDQAV